MQTDVNILLGKRRVMDYILPPHQTRRKRITRAASLGGAPAVRCRDISELVKKIPRLLRHKFLVGTEDAPRKRVFGEGTLGNNDWRLKRAFREDRFHREWWLG